VDAHRTAGVSTQRGARRRNAISAGDERMVLFVAVASAADTIAAGSSPTGNVVTDAVWSAALAMVTVWAAASTPWWAAFGATTLAALSATSGPTILLVVALAAGVPLLAIGARGASAPVVRSACVAIALSVLVRSEWRPFETASALLTAAAVVLVVATALPRRHRSVRRTAVRVTVVVTSIVGLAVVGLAVALSLAAGDASDGADDLTDGLRLLQSGDTAAASISLAEAATTLADASDRFDAWYTAPARVIPVLAPHRDALASTTAQAADAAAVAAIAVGLVDPSQLEFVGGAIDTATIALVADPLSDLDDSMQQLQTIAAQARSPWLLPAVSNRLDDIAVTADDAARAVRTASAVVEVVPALFGDEGDRRYLIAFVNPAESRGSGGVMGNWSEVTATKGVIRQTASGRTADLTIGLEQAEPLRLDMPDDHLARFAAAGAADDDGFVDPLYWSNVTMSADMPSVGSAMAQMYSAATGRRVDGVAIVDPRGVAALLRLTGPIEIETLDRTLDAGSAVSFLTTEQYELPSGEREAVLSELTAAAMSVLTSQVIADPVVIGDALGGVAADGNITVWMRDTDEQALIGRLGADGALPDLDGADGLAVTFDNAAGNKADTYLTTAIEYHPVFDPSTGEVDAVLTVTVTNDAPRIGRPDYVIGNLIGEPAGSNLTLVNVHTPLQFTGATLDGAPTTLATERERGWNVFTLAVALGSGDSAVLEVHLTARTRRDEYRLVVRPPDLPQDTAWRIEGSDVDGRLIAGFVGVLERRVVIDRRGMTDWRTDEG
jgi:hypothetical protein